jgi:hypothetical protein
VPSVAGKLYLLSVIILNVVMLSVVTLNVVAPIALVAEQLNHELNFAGLNPAGWDK